MIQLYYNKEKRGITVTEHELMEKWLSVFGKNADKKMMEEHVLAPCNFPWHVFSWCGVSCLEGDAARKAFDALVWEHAICFYSGYNLQIEDVSVTGRVTAEQLDRLPLRDVYITAEDFSWTYVRTHEEGIGPYFCIKERTP